MHLLAGILQKYLNGWQQTYAHLLRQLSEVLISLREPGRSMATADAGRRLVLAALLPNGCAPDVNPGRRLVY